MFFNWFRKKTCPNCSLQWSWDGYKCIRCGYVKKLAKRKQELFTQIMDLFDPKTHDPYELYHKKDLIPQSPGVYAWYFDNHFSDYFIHKSESVIAIDLDSVRIRDWYLLYIGIAGEKRGRTLRDRIYGDHLNQNSDGSTLRQSLAALLWQYINLDPAMQLNGENEKNKLNRWIFKHAKIAWIETHKPKIIEKRMLKEFGHLLRFNIQDNKENPYRKELMKRRKNWRKRK